MKITLEFDCNLCLVKWLQWFLLSNSLLNQKQQPQEAFDSFCECVWLQAEETESCVYGDSLRMMGFGPCQLWRYENACCCPPSEEQWWHLCLYCHPEHKLGTRSRENWPAVINRDIIRGINNSDLSFVVKCRGNHGSVYTVLTVYTACVETYWKIHQRGRGVWKWCRCRADLLLQYMLNGATSWRIGLVFWFMTLLYIYCTKLAMLECCRWLLGQ